MLTAVFIMKLIGINIQLLLIWLSNINVFTVNINEIILAHLHYAANQGLK